MIESNWLELWRKLAAATHKTRKKRKESRYESHFLRKGRDRPDPLRDFVLQNISDNQTLLDVGAGNGRWVIPAARVARSVTAVEPSDNTISVLRERIGESGLDNIRILQNRWEEAIVEPHDFITCVHAIYECQDFDVFVRKMEKYARETCYLVVRFPPIDSIISELSLSIYGHPYDSTNAIIAYNALYSMGIYANVLVEDNIHHWTDPTFEEAVTRAKEHLNLESSTEYDDLIRDVLGRRLTSLDNTCIWPDGMRSALLWWSPGKERTE